jgi:hypothetical protein
VSPVFEAVHEATKVSFSKLKHLFENTAMEDIDGEKVLRVLVADCSTHTPSVRMDLRGSTWNNGSYFIVTFLKVTAPVKCVHCYRGCNFYCYPGCNFYCYNKVTAGVTLLLR